jgi:hypothetical protein
MFYYLYEVKNNLNGKIYVGVHKTKSMDDGYMGSGKIICSAITKHGIVNFSKVILETFEDSESMYAREKEVVTDEFLLREDVYNLRRGGTGGFDYINRSRNPIERLEHNRTALKKARIASASALANEDKRNARIKSISDTVNAKILLGAITGTMNAECSEKATKAAQSESACNKRKKTRIERKFQQKENNSQFGTTWIWHEMFGNKKIVKELVPEYIEQGWYRMYKPKYIVPQ